MKLRSLDSQDFLSELRMKLGFDSARAALIYCSTSPHSSPKLASELSKSMLQSAIYADLHAQDFGFSYLNHLQQLPHQVAQKVSFARFAGWSRGFLRRNELQDLNAHLRRDIGIDG